MGGLLVFPVGLGIEAPGDLKVSDSLDGWAGSIKVMEPMQS